MTAGFPGGRLAGYAAAAAVTLQDWYDQRSGLWAIPPGQPRGPGDPGWWNSANALYALIDYMSLTGTSGYLDVVANTFDKHMGSGFLNDFYDDEGWWALTWISAHDLTRGTSGKRDYLQAARGIFADMERGWDPRTHDGGVLWRKGSPGKNSIENELFLAVAVRLGQRVPDRERAAYRQWAERAGQWLHDNFVIADPGHLIYDGLNSAGGHEGHQQTYTYTQGVILGALADMAASGLAIAGREPLGVARQVADAVLASPALVHDGVLTEFGQADAGDSTDLPQFKGIFMRNLSYLAERVGRPGNSGYVDLIRRTAGSLLGSGRNSAGQFGYRWQGPVDAPDAIRQSAALEALNAALRVGITAA